MPSRLQTTAFASLFIYCGVDWARPSETPKRLTPKEIAALPSLGAGTGTSGVTGILTTVLSGNPDHPGPALTLQRALV